MTDRTITFGYIRVSGVDQIRGSSINTQKDSIVLYAKLMNLNIKTIYCDAGVSGALPLSKRPQGKLLLQELKKQKTNLIVFSVDRLARSRKSIAEELPDTVIHFSNLELFPCTKEVCLFAAAETQIQNLEFIFRSLFGDKYECVMNNMLSNESFLSALIDNMKLNGMQISFNDTLKLIKEAA